MKKGKPVVSEGASAAEEMRQDRLKKLKEEYGPIAELQGVYGPGGLGCHEALHATTIAMGMIGANLLDHPAIALNRDWHRKAASAYDILFELSQDIAEAHLGPELLRGVTEGSEEPR